MIAPAKFAHLPDRALLRVDGEDWRGFLQGLITQDVETLRPGEIRFGALLTPQGRLLFDLFLIGEADGALLDVHAASRDALKMRLSIYRLRAKVRIEAVEGGVFALWEAEGAGEPWRRDPRLPALGWRAVGEVATPAGADAVEAAAYHAHRLALGVPDPVRDCPADRTYPIEADFDLLGGIDFKKGCFVGQETTSRMKRRGAIRSRMTAIAFDGPVPAFGSEVLAGTLRAGEVLSGIDGRAMALLRLDRLESGPLTVDGRPARVEAPDWLGLKTTPDT
ncbi:MAG: folate-binding protein [Caulobacteraceae bacterium]